MNLISVADACLLLEMERTRLYKAARRGDIDIFNLKTGTLIDLSVRNTGAHYGFDRDQLLAFRQRDAAERPPAPPPRPWISRAKCRGMNNEDRDRIFFPEGDKPDGLEAKKLCFSCPVRLDCLRDAPRAGIVQCFVAGVGPSQLAKFGTAWRQHRELPYICRWCGDGFLESKSGSALYCRDSCRLKLEETGGIDSKHSLASHSNSE